MKRILSILLSITIVASMLVSMSVTSFAVADGYPETVKFKTVVTAIPEEDYATWEETFEESYAGKHLFIITATYYGFGDLSCSTYNKTTNKYVRELGMSNYDVKYMSETPMSAFYPLDPGYCYGYEDGELAEELEIATDYNAYDFSYNEYGTFQSGTATVRNTMPNAKKTLYDAEVVFNYFAACDTDTFVLDVDKTLLVLNMTSGNAVSSEQYYREPDANVAAYGVVEVDSLKVYVKDGVQVSKEEYEGGSSEPVTHAFTVYAEDGSVLASADVEEGAAIEMPTAPAVTGKTFSHWATTEGGSAVEPATTMGTEDLTYYAVYETNKYTITYIIDGREETKTVEHGQATDYTGATPTKEGYDFTGWDKPFAPATGDATYVAQFAIKTYTIKFDVNGTITTVTVNHGERPVYDGTPSKEGHTFTGWDNEIVAATANATYVAQFEPNAPTQYTITFKVDGQADVVITVNAGSEPVYPNGTPTKEGFTFTGWSPEIASATADATYVAQFTENPDAVVMGTPVHQTANVLPGNADSVEVGEFTVLASELLRVHTTFEYNSEYGTLAEMGMLFVPKAVAGAMSQDEIIAAGITKDACCKDIANLTGNANVTFKAGLVGVPKKGIEIYAIPYYKLSTGGRIYQTMQTITFE